MLIEGAEEEGEMGEFCMEMRGEDETRSEERFQGNAVAESCVCVCAQACVCMIGSLCCCARGMPKPWHES